VRILRAPFDYVRSSLARKLVAVVVLIFGMLTLLLIWQLATREGRALETQRIEQAEGVASMLATSGAPWVLSEDRAGLQELTSAAASMKAHRYSLFLDRSGRVLAHSDSRLVGRHMVDARAESLLRGPARPILIAVTADAVDVAAPVIVDGRHVGWAWVSIDMADVRAAIERLVIHAAAYGVAAIAIGLFVTLLIARGVTRRTADLAAVSKRFRNGERNIRIAVRGRDEVAAAARGVNKMLEAVSDSERSVREVQRVAGLVSWRYDPELPRLEWPDEVYQLFGFDPAGGAPSFQEFLDRLPGEQSRTLRALAGAPNDVVSSLTLTPKRSDGRERICWVEVRSERSAKGTRVLSLICQDVTEREAAAAQLRQAQKMEAVGQLTGGLAHDFNNLLAIVIGNLDLASEALEEGSLAREATDEALEAALRGSKLTKQLLAFSRRQTLAARSVDLNALIREFEPLWRRTVGADIEVRMRLAEDLQLTKVDPAQVESAILNLVINARDAMPNGGVLTVETGRLELQQAGIEPAFDEVPSGSYSVITVSDTGHGMPPEVVQHAIEPFFTTKGVGRGSGLGLSMIYGFVKQSGGHLKIYSEPDHGTAVRILLPVSEEAADPAKPLGRKGPLPLAKEETILVVEDDDKVRQIVLRQLGELGYNVVSAADGARALKLLGRHKVDLLFTDIVMPGGMSGLELGERAGAAFPMLRILYTSGFTRAGVANGAAGMVLLSKPYRKSDLAACVRQVLDSPLPDRAKVMA
jgi:signal transduction histidine kinase/HAMP domain-containing protein